MPSDITTYTPDGARQIPLLVELTKDVRMPKLVHELVMPRVGVPARTFKVPTFLNGMDRRTAIDTKVAPHERPPVLTYSRDVETHSLDPHTLDGMIEKLDAQEQRDGLVVETEVARNITMAMLMEKEWLVSTLATDHTGFPSSQRQVISSAGDQWDHLDGDGLNDVDPRVKLDEFSDAMFSATGFRPNMAVTTLGVMRVLRRHTLLRRAANMMSGSYVGPELSDEQIAALFGLDRIIIGEASGYSPISAARYDFWGPHFTAFYGTATPSRNSLSWGYEFFNTHAENGSFMRYIDVPHNETEFLRRKEEYKHIVLAPEVGLIVKNVIGPLS